MSALLMVSIVSWKYKISQNATRNLYADFGNRKRGYRKHKISETKS
jgi:hypothetical protein